MFDSATSKFLAIAFVGSLALAPSRARAQAAPSSSHPRLWLDGATRTALTAQAADPNGAVARGAARCAAARARPSDYATGGWQGFEFVTTLSGCLVSWAATGGADDLATAIKYWNVLLDDYQTVGDGAGGDTVVTHDTGYAMRTFAPYSAIAYDWLHDAPGVSEDLRAHARARFNAWSTYYSTQGYLRHMAGANYQSGYTFAATLMAIAESGEAGSSGDAQWANVRDSIWGQDMSAGLGNGGILEGGDWAEGWQYGPLSVLEYALAARAMQDNGVTIAGAAHWTASLVLRFAHGLTPATKKMFAGGDNESTTANLDPVNGALLAAMLGPSDLASQQWASRLNRNLDLKNDNPLFDALAQARAAGSSGMHANAPTSYLATGVGNWYVRSDWTPTASWAVFQCARRLVADHQHNDAGNWVLARGADDVVVDPSPYGSLSSLTGNAPAIDSAVLPDGYSPSQGMWGQATRFVWAKQSSTAIGVARCDYADQFRREDAPSDVAHATRDFIFVPNGDASSVVLVDRAVTGDAARALHLRVRTPGALVLAGDTATGTIGTSSLAIRSIWSPGGAMNVRDMPVSPECSSTNHGACDISRLPSGQEYRIDIPGGNAAAIHVIDAQSAGAPGLTNLALSGPGYHGVLLDRGAASVAIVTNDGSDGAPGSSLVYRVRANGGTRHVVVDAPVDANGKSDVTGALDGTDCVMRVVPHAGGEGGFDGNGLLLRVSDSCAVTEDLAVAPASPGGTNGDPNASGGDAGAAVAAQAGVSASNNSKSGNTSNPKGYDPGAADIGSCNLSARRRKSFALDAAMASLGLTLFAARRRRRGRHGTLDLHRGALAHDRSELPARDMRSDRLVKFDREG